MNQLRFTNGMHLTHEGCEVVVTDVTNTTYTVTTCNPMDEWQQWTLPLPRRPRRHARTVKRDCPECFLEYGHEVWCKKSE